MRKLRDVLRLRLEAGLSFRQINASQGECRCHPEVDDLRAEELALNWPPPVELDDNQLASLFYPRADTRTSSRHQTPTGQPSIRSSNEWGDQAVAVGGVYPAISQPLLQLLPVLRSL